MHVPNPKGDLWDIRINIDRDGGNVPMVYDCAVTAKEMKVIGPQIRSALNHVEQKVDFLGGFAEKYYAQWSIKTVDREFDHFAGVCQPCAMPTVASADNLNLTSAQKELLLWHWKLGISMHRIQELMKDQPMEDPAGVTSVAKQVIKPQMASAATCSHPVCQSC